jgi:integrase
MSRRAPGEGTLYQDGDGRWYGQASASINPKTGNRRRVKITGKPGESKASVARRLRDRIAELEASDSSGPETVGELVVLWRQLSAPKRNSPSTLEGIDALIRKHIKPVFDKVKIAAVTPDDIESFLAARDYLSKSMMTKTKRILSQAFDFAVRRRYATWNPARVAEIPPGLKRDREQRSLTVAEARALLNVADHHRNGAFITVSMTLGLRVQEASALSWDNIDFDRGTLQVVQALTWTSDGPRLKDPKTPRSKRTVDMPPITIRALKRHKAQLDEERLLLKHKWPKKWESLVFVSSVGTPLHPSNLRRWLSQLALEAGIEGTVTPRNMRTTAGSLLSHEGIALERIADLLGHQDIRTLQLHYRRPVAPSVDTATDYWKGATKGANHPEKESSENTNGDRRKRVGPR